MKYFVSSGSDLDTLGAGPDIGIMTGPRCGMFQSIKAGRTWAVDCDALSKHGYDEDAHLKHLERMQPYWQTCAFMVVPDVPGDGWATKHLFELGGDLFGELPFPLAYCLQDGCEALDFPLGAAVAFLGGTDGWRRQWGAEMLARAHAEGLGTHVGRVNSRSRMQALRFTHAGSADGTYLAFAGARAGVKAVNGWLAAANAPALFEASDFTHQGQENLPLERLTVTRRAG